MGVFSKRILKHLIDFMRDRWGMKVFFRCQKKYVCLASEMYKVVFFFFFNFQEEIKRI